MNDFITEDNKLSLIDRLSLLPKIGLNDFIDQSIRLPFNHDHESRSYVLEGNITEEQLLRLNRELDFECSILVIDKVRVLLTGSSRSTSNEKRQMVAEASKGSVTVNFHSHTKSDTLQYPSGGDFANFDSAQGMHALATGGKLLSYKIPEDLKDEDMRDVLIRNVGNKLGELGEKTDPFDLLSANHNRFIELFISTLPTETVLYNTKEIVTALNP